jgi:hypothetical protein
MAVLTVNDPCLDVGLGDREGGGDFRVGDLLRCAPAAEGSEGDQSEFSDNGFWGELGNA